MTVKHLGELEKYQLLSVLERGVLRSVLKNVWYLSSGSLISSQIVNGKVASSVTLCQNECLRFLDPSWKYPGQYILKPFRIRMPLLLCGSLPLTLLVWVSLVTEATGRGVAFHQKSSVLNKSPNLAGDFISFSASGQL